MTDEQATRSSLAPRQGKDGAEAGRRPGRGEIGSKGPERAWLVTTSKCNLNCVHCARSIPEFRAAAEATPDMEEEVFRLFELQVAPTLRTVQFGGTNLGEPMMSRGLEGHIARLKEFGGLEEVKIQTNGTYLLNPSRLEELVRLGVRIMVSLEGVTEESYRRVRGVSFERVKEGLFELKRIREAHPESKTELLLAFTVRYDSLPELVPLVELASDVGASQVTVSHFRPVRESHRHQSLYYHRGESNAAMEAAAKRAADLGIDFVAPGPFEIPEFTDDLVVRTNGSRTEPPCFHPWTSVSVSEQGDVMPCCATNAVMGNLKKQDFQSIWNGRRYRRLRKSVNSSRPPSFCQGCVLRGVDLDSSRGQLFTEESYLLRSIGVQREIEGVGPFLATIRRRAMNAVRSRLNSNTVARRLALGLRRIYWRLG